MTTDGAPRPKPQMVYRAREVLVSFLFTFIAARVMVFLIMSHRVRDLYFHVHGTHVHHLNYGIFLLTFVGGYLIFAQPAGKLLSLTSIIYGVGLALTFDEFGMWLHLGGPYWQRLSFDAIVVITALLSLFAFAPSWRRFKPRHWITTVLLLMALAAFSRYIYTEAQNVGREIGPSLQQLDQESPE
jgi:hypothetical protein